MIPWLTILAATPLVGAAVLMLASRAMNARVIAFGFSLLTLAISLAMLCQYDLGGDGYQLEEKHHWIDAFGAWYSVGINGIGVTLILLTTVLTPVVILASWNDKISGRRSFNSYFAWMLALEGLALGVFMATDLFLFYVLFEATLIPLYFLIGGYGAANRTYAAVKFLIYNLVGGLIMLAAVVGIFVVTTRDGGPTYLLSDLMQVDFGIETGRWFFLAFFLAFAIKAPLWPLHTWLPDAAGAATPGTSVLMVSIVDKIGTFAMIRFCLGMFPEASQWASPVVVTLAVISILYGALLAIGQDDIRRLIAFTSVSHFGFIILGIFIFTTPSTVGSTLYMFNHGLSTAALFLVTGMLIARRGSARISDFGGVQKNAPILAGIFLVAGLSSLSLPGLAPFVSEFLVLAGTFSRSVTAAAFATLGIILAALYILIMYQRTMTGPLREDNAHVTELRPREIAALAPTVVLIVGLGFFPQPLLNVINPAVDQVVSGVGVGDPPAQTVFELDNAVRSEGGSE